MPRPHATHRHTPSRSLQEPDRTYALMRGALARGDHAEATMLFERLGTTHWVPRRPDLVPWLARELGAHATRLLVGAFAGLACHFCRAQWAACPKCEGRGEDQRGRACGVCAGLGLGCCAACNGSGLVNYAAVPVGIRGAVMRARVARGAATIRGLKSKAGKRTRDAAEARLRGVIAARAMLANAVRAASESSSGFARAREAIPATTRARVTRMTRRVMADAEVALRSAIANLAEVEGRAARAGSSVGVGERNARRAERLLRLAGRVSFTSPLLLRRAFGTIERG